MEKEEVGEEAEVGEGEEGGSLYIMPDGRIVAVSSTAMDMIAEMGEVEEGREGGREVGEGKEGEELVAGGELDFDSQVETVTVYRCRTCAFTTEAREVAARHVREEHLYIKAIQEAKVLVSDGVEVGEGEEEEVEVSRSVTGLSIIVSGEQEQGVAFDTNQFSIIVEKEMLEEGAKEVGKVEGAKVRAVEYEAGHEQRVLACGVKSCSFLFKRREELEYHMSCHRWLLYSPPA